MLSGKQVRVRIVRTKVVPQYIDVTQPELVETAGSLIELFRSLTGHTRDEVDAEVTELVGDQPSQIVHQGLAKLLEDRCEFEVESGIAPDDLRSRVFLAGAAYRASHEGGLDRQVIFDQVAAEVGLTAEQVERSLFADLKGEQRLITFDDITAEQLLQRYNVALAQAIILRAIRVEVLIRNEPPTRLRALMRAIKFHRLICAIESPAEGCISLKLDGPLSLFSATVKYGAQLAFFLPHLLQCRDFDMRAHVRWGAQRVEKLFVMSSEDNLVSHLPDYGSYTPKELLAFIEQFNKQHSAWHISEEPEVIPTGNRFWVPDFKLTHHLSKQVIHLEIIGFWRKVQVMEQLTRLRAALPNRFLLAVSEQYQVEEEDPRAELPPDIYYFKRTPLPDEIVRRANQLMATH